MSNYSVVLKEWKKIPHLKIGNEIASMISIHKQDIFTSLRRQNGIVFQGLMQSEAEKIAKFLTDEGFPSASIPDDDLNLRFDFQLIRNADVINEGLEIENPYGKKSLVSSDTIKYIHAGYVDESLKDSDGRMGLFGTLSGSGQGAVEGPPIKPISTAGQLGWVLHLFIDDELSTVYRIIESKFYYDYQGKEFVSPVLKFATLVEDIDRLWDNAALDKNIKPAMESLPEIPPDIRYDTLEDLEDRIRWSMTVQS